jgi:hypothetical protein
MPPSTHYERGDALVEVLPQVLPDGERHTNDLPTDPTLFDLTEEQYWNWLTALVDQGSEIDQQLDELLDSVYECQSPFYSFAGRRRLNALLDELHEARASIRAFEYDVEELTYAFARSDTIETKASENAEMTLAQIKATYNRAYDLCLHKMDRMGDGWITASNFLISIVMLVVTILFWMEFR